MKSKHVTIKPLSSNCGFYMYVALVIILYKVVLTFVSVDVNL